MEERNALAISEYRDDFKVYKKLDRNVQLLDYQTLIPVAEFLIAKIQNNARGAIAEALFNSDRQQNAQFPLMASALAVAQGRPSGYGPEGALIYFSDESDDTLGGFSFLDEVRCTASHDYSRYIGRVTTEEVVDTRQALEDAELIYLADEGTWRTFEKGSALHTVLEDMRTTGLRQLHAA